MSFVHGFHAVREVLNTHPERVRALYYVQGRRDTRVQEVIALAKAAGLRFEAVQKSWLDQRVEGNHQGVAAFCQELAPLHEEEFIPLLASLPQPRLLLVLDGVTDPRNLGACLRSANAAGVQAVIFPERNTAPINDVVLKTAAGGAESLRLVAVTNLARHLERLKEAGIWLVGTDDTAPAPWHAVDYTGDIAIVMGSEGSGMRRLTREACDHLVGIPMAGAVESLNVSVAAGILLFEVVRQRS
ncbi:MAG: 23S rRNA (guanosine(2251)-2'-O)-methyltransferase RlmB [Pseudomonadales bacterium]|nr:23S rRNA (guanosine(2251)-2'-O)-methyltransferase RlmB [Pseudomonadales bacterium]MCP5183259.1 23S rRNA (guanosine(2251)-2'-O)-methyltransferase RlmB [Pseudomonadales bacterium]